LLSLCNLVIPLPVSQYHQEDDENKNIDMETTCTPRVEMLQKLNKKSTVTKHQRRRQKKLIKFVYFIAVPLHVTWSLGPV
jgi:hypothetical protein